MNERARILETLSDSELILIVAQGETVNLLPAGIKNRAARWENAQRCGVPIESLRKSPKRFAERKVVKRGSVIDSDWIDKEIRVRADELFAGEGGMNREDALLQAVADVEQVIRHEGLRCVYRPKKKNEPIHEEAA